MGYRSEVALFFKHPQAKQLLADYAERTELFQEALIGAESGSCLAEFRMSADTYKGTPWVLLRWDYIKWYASTTWVQEVERFVVDVGGMCDADETGRCALAFVRIGEESEDVEEKFYGADAYDYMSVSRSICTSV